MDFMPYVYLKCTLGSRTFKNGRTWLINIQEYHLDLFCHKYKDITLCECMVATMIILMHKKYTSITTPLVLMNMQFSPIYKLKYAQYLNVDEEVQFIVYSWCSPNSTWNK